MAGVLLSPSRGLHTSAAPGPAPLMTSGRRMMVVPMATPTLRIAMGTSPSTSSFHSANGGRVGAPPRDDSAPAMEAQLTHRMHSHTQPHTHSRTHIATITGYILWHTGASSHILTRS